MTAGILGRLYSALVEDDEDHGRGDLPRSASRSVPGNAVRLAGSLSLQKTGDRVADPKTVLAWLLTAAGAPGYATALLVPIRESGSLLPQVFLVPVVRRFALRKRVWVVGAIGQAAAIAAMGVAGVLLGGTALAIVVLAALAVFASFRAFGSISSKDVLGKTIPFRERGSVIGIAASIAGGAAIGAGVLISLFLRDAGPTALALVVAGSALLWLGAGALFLTVAEEPSPGDTVEAATSPGKALELLADDAPFRRFVIARSLLLVSALSPPFVVALSASVDESRVSGVGAFVAATGIAGLVASPIWGRLADDSARLVMTAAAAGSAGVIAAFLGLRQLGLDSTWWLGPGAYLLLAITHAGARMGRKTYVVDLAGGDRRTTYVGVSNTVIGVILAAAGVIGAVVSSIGPAWALAGLAAAGVGGAFVALSMDEIQDR